MKQTNLFNCRLSMGRPRFAKPLGLTVVCLALMFILGTQNSTAQTVSELGEVRSDLTIQLVQGEMQSLEQEMKNPVGPVKTGKNEQVIRYYSDVISSFRGGADIKVALLDTESTNGTSDDGAAVFATHPENSVMDPLSTDHKDLEILVDQLNLFDNDNSDLVAIFNYWRTLKNR